MNMTKGPDLALRIVSGRAELIEAQLNELMYEYTPTHWAFSTVGDHVELTVVLLHDREVRKSALAQPQVQIIPNGRR